jgi:hypothetical protein
LLLEVSVLEDRENAMQELLQKYEAHCQTHKVPLSSSENPVKRSGHLPLRDASSSADGPDRNTPPTNPEPPTIAVDSLIEALMPSARTSMQLALDAALADGVDRAQLEQVIGYLNQGSTSLKAVAPLLMHILPLIQSPLMPARAVAAGDSPCMPPLATPSLNDTQLIRPHDTVEKRDVVRRAQKHLSGLPLLLVPVVEGLVQRKCDRARLAFRCRQYLCDKLKPEIPTVETDPRAENRLTVLVSGSRVSLTRSRMSEAQLRLFETANADLKPMKDLLGTIIEDISRMESILLAEARDSVDALVDTLLELYSEIFYVSGTTNIANVLEVPQPSHRGEGKNEIHSASRPLARHASQRQILLDQFFDDLPV